MPKDTIDVRKPIPRQRVRKSLSGAGGGGGKGGGGPPVESANTLQTNAILRLIEVLGEGPIKGVRQVYLNETPLTDDEGNPNFEGVSVEYRLGLPSQSPVPGFADQAADLIVDALVEKDTPVIQTITDPATDAARVTIKIPALFEYKDNGDMVGTGVSFRIQYRSNGGAWIDIQGSPFNLVNEKNTAPVFLPYRFPLTGSAPWDIRVTRITDDTTDNSKLQNSIYFFGTSQILEQKFTYPDTAYMAMVVNAQQFGEQVPSRAALVDGLICKVPTNFNPLTRTYTGMWNGTFKEEWTDCPAWCTYEMITNPRFGLGEFINTSFIDTITLYSISQYCAQQVDNGQGGTEPRFTFNAYLGTRQEAYDLINAMVSVFRGMVYWSLGAAMFTHDAPASPILTVSRANTVNGDFSYQGASILTVHNRVNVTYNNPENFYKRDVVTVDDPEHIAKYGLRPTDIIAFGCTSKSQALRAGRWLMFTERMESDVLTYVAGPDHVDAVPGSIVRVMDPSVMGVSMSGRVKAYTATTLTLDREVDLLPGVTYELVVHDTDRVLHYRAVTSAPGATSAVTVSVALPAMTKNPLETVWALRRTDGPDTLYRILSLKEVGDHQYEVTAIRHNPDKYSIIENGYEIPAYPESMLPTGPLPVPANLQVREQVVPTSGTQDRPSLIVSLTRPSDPRVRGVELQYRRLGQEWRTVDMRSNPTHTIDTAVPGDRYQFQCRSYDPLGNTSVFSDVLNLEVRGNPTSKVIPNVTGAAVSGGVRQIEVRWTNPATLTSFKEVEVFAGSTNVEANAVKVGATPAERFIIGNLATGQIRHVWLRVVAHGEPLQRTATIYAGAATTQAIGNGDVAPNSLSLDRMGVSVIDAINAAAGSAAGDVLAAQAARDAAQVAATNSVTAQNAAQTAMNDAIAARNAAQAAQGLALGSQNLAQTAQAAAAQANTDAQAALAQTITARNAAQLAETNSVTARNAAQAAQTAAQTARTGAETAQAAALASANSASTSSSAAVSASLSAAGAYAVAGPTQLRIPADAWTNGSNTATTALLKPAAPGAQFITNDADFGDCYEFQSTGNLLLGPAYGFQYQTGRVYDVTFRFKVVTGPCRTAFGITTQLGAAQVQNAVPSNTTDFTTGNGLITRVIRFGPTGTSTAGADALVVLGAGAADRAYPYIRQNTATTTGRLRVAQISTRDVTDLLSAASSASAAATQSAAAGVSATDAAQSANAAQIARTAAETARSGAESAQTSAATSATNAASSAASASTSATNAANSSNTAGSAATAAQTSAGQASTSATNAALSATSAADSAVSARITLTNGPILPFDFRDGLSQWTSARNGDPATLPDPGGYTIVSDAELGQAAAATWNTAGTNLLTRGVLNTQAGRIYRMTAIFKVLSTTGDATMQLTSVARTMDNAYAGGTDNFGPSVAFAPSATTVYQLTRTFSSVAQTGVDQVIAGMATLPFMRVGLRAGETGKNAAIRIGMIRVEDVTESVLSGNAATNAAGSAGAAATSASNASASATQAGTFASNANTSATTAANSATNAANSASAASTSATNASTSASAAATSATTATNQANTASTAAGNASTSASQAATSASNALGSANSAATSASTAADTLSTVDRLAANLLPNDFVEDGRFWTNSTSGVPATRSALDTAIWVPDTITNVGRVLRVTAPQAASRNLMPRGYVSATNGRRYRAIVRARHVGAFVGNSASAFRLFLRRYASYTTTTGDIVNPTVPFTAPNVWQDIVVEGVMNTEDPFLSVIVQIQTANFNTVGPVIEVQRVTIQDVTAMVAAEDAASAAATSASTAAGLQTSAASSASAAATSATNANTSAGNASTSATQAANSATSAAGSASAASTSATNAANSASAAGGSATAAGTSASNASTSATNAAQSATSAAQSLVSARLSIMNGPVLPYDFTDGLVHWTRTRNGAPGAVTDPSGATIVADAELGQAMNVALASNSTLANILSKGVVALQAGRVYRVTIRFKLFAATANIDFQPILSLMNSAYADTGNETPTAVSYAQSATTVYEVSTTFSSASIPGVDRVNALLGTSAFFRAGLQRTTSSASGSATVRIGLIQVQDVTQEILSANSANTAATSATAASGSASTAATHATNAGTSATAAAASATTAATQAGNASTSASQAATSATNALGSANSASTSATTAANARQAAENAANILFPSDFQNKGAHFTTSESGAFNPPSVPDTSFRTVAGIGQVFFNTGFALLSTKGMVAAIPGETYYFEVRARVTTNSTLTGGDKEAATLDLRGFDAAGAATYKYFTLTPRAGLPVGMTIIRVANGWVTFGGTYTIPASPVTPFIKPRFYVGFDAAGNGNAVWEVDHYIVRNVTSEVAAEGSAAAAATSASAASASQTAAGASASSAQTSATNAATSAGQAGTSAGNAATSASAASTSASNALGSANAAATSATVSANSAAEAAVSAAGNICTDALLLTVPHQWTSSLSGVITRVTHGQAGTTLPTAIRTTGPSGQAGVYSPFGPAVTGGNRTYRISGKYRTSGTVGTVSAGVSTDLAGTSVSTAIPVVGPAATTFTAFTVDHVLTANHDGTRFRGAITGASGSVWVEFTDIQILDVTAQLAAANSASAAATSASNAATSATNAGNSASAANTSATNANTSAANANTSAISASSAATNAAGSSAQALEYRNAAARMTSGGVSKNPVFNDWSGASPANVQIFTGGTTTFNKITSNVRYVNAVELVGNDTTQNRPIVRINTAVHTLDCVPTPDRVIVRAEVELVSGALTGGAYIAAVWANNSGGTDVIAVKLLTDFMVAQTGRVQTIEWYVERPAGYVAGTVPQFYIEVCAVSNQLGATRAACTLEVHRLDFEVVTANSMAEIFQRAKVAVDGIQSSAIGLRAVAGSAGALLELVALDDPAGNTASAARIAASTILLDGSVGTDQLAVGLGRNLLTNTDFTDTTSGWVIRYSEGTGGGATVLDLKPAGVWAGAFYPTLRMTQASAATDGFCDVEHRPTMPNGYTAPGAPVTAGRWYDVSIQASVQRCTFELRLRFYNAAGAYLSDSAVLATATNVTSSSTDPEVWPRYWGKMQAPTGAAYATIHIRKRATTAGASPANSYVFMHKPQLAETVANATTPVMFSQGGTTLIAGGKIITRSLTAKHLATNTITAASAVLANASVETLTIAGGAVTVPVSTFMPGIFTVGGYDSWTTAAILAINRAGFDTHIQFNCSLDCTNPAVLMLRVKRGSTVLSTHFHGIYGNQEQVSLAFVDTDGGTGRTLYSVEVCKASSAVTGGWNGNMRVFKRLLRVQQFKR